jgi:SAM-dependent methyltransferase
MQQFHNVIRQSGIRAKRALEVGGVTGKNSLLNFPELEDAERFSLNLVDMADENGVNAVTGNANDMKGVFEDDSFDLVLCCSTLEHDKHFWLSIAEMKRVMRPGGMLVIGVPGYVKDTENDRGRSTLTYRVHYAFDFYRFSEQAVREVFFADMDRVEVMAYMTPPRLLGHGFKPGNETVYRKRALSVREITARIRARG